MPITLNDFKEGGSLRNFVTQVGLLGKIGKDGVDQAKLLNTLINSVTMVGAYSDGAITSADSVSDKFSKEEDKNTGSNTTSEGGNSGSKDPVGGENTEGSNTNKPNEKEPTGEQGDKQEPTDDPKEEESEPEDEQGDDTPEDVDSPSVDPTDGE